MTFFDFIVLGTFVLGLVNAFCLCMLTISVDRDIDDLKECKANKEELDAHKKVVRQSLDVLREDHKSSMKRMRQKFNVVNAKVSRKKKARVVFFDHVNEKGAKNE